jgi:hypothetical protein
MDIIILLGAMCLAYGGMLVLYYRLRTTEKRKELSYLMLNGIKSMRRGNLDKALIYLIRLMNIPLKQVTGKKWQMHFIIWV